MVQRTFCTSKAMPHCRTPLATLLLLLALAPLTTGCNEESRDNGEADFSLHFVSPSENAVVSEGTLLVLEVRPATPGLEVWAGNTAILQSASGGRYTFEWSPQGGGGEIVLTATATDPATHAQATATRRFVHHPSYLPRWRICDPDCHPIFDPMVVEGTVAFTLQLTGAHQSDPATAQVLIDGGVVAEASEYPFDMSVDTTGLADGNHTLTLRFAPTFGERIEHTSSVRIANCDRDGDGFDGPHCGGSDCDDDDITVYPGAPEICDGKLQDCNGTIDQGATCEGLGAVCLAGSCQSGQCVAQDQRCSDVSQDTWAFVCDVDDGRCRQRCATDHGNPLLACGEGLSCRATTAITERNQGWCERVECDGLTPGECGDEELCIAYDFGFGECGAPGVGQEGELCAIPGRSDTTLEAPCAADFECFGGVCSRLCDPDNPLTCGAGESCSRIWDSVRETSAGLCLRPCQKFGTEGCDAGSSCQPLADYAFSKTTGWGCVQAPGGVVLRGETCVRGQDVCESGTHCVNPVGPTGGQSRCLGACDQPGTNPLCEAGEVCAFVQGSSRLSCIEECTPFPRREDGDYGCADSGDTCQPRVGAGGVCVPNENSRQVGDACPTPGRFGSCPDAGYCRGLEADDAPTCHRICKPGAASSTCEDDEVCNPLPLVDGVGGIGVCDPAPVEGSEGDLCTVPGRACASDGSVCLDDGTAARCRRLCGSPDDCSESRCLFGAPLEGVLYRGQAGVCEL